MASPKSNSFIVVLSVIATLIGAAIIFLSKKLRLLINSYRENPISSEVWENYTWTAIIIIIVWVFVFDIFFGAFLAQLLARKQKYSRISTRIRKISWLVKKLDCISVLGVANSGKTRLIENICTIPYQNEVTLGYWAYITSLPVDSNNKVIFLDSSGQSRNSQYDLALYSNYLIVLIDHNDAHNINEVDPERIKENIDFIDGLFDRLRTKSHTPNFIQFLLNKEDLWASLDEGEVNQMRQQFSEKIESYSNEFRNTKILFTDYSNILVEKRTEIILSIEANQKA
ncbi:MAG: hypothetical protein AAF502_24785 [Bacteroidota bacterium]